MKRSAFAFVLALGLWGFGITAQPVRAYICPGSSTNYATTCIGVSDGVACISTASAGAGCCAPGKCKSQVCNLPTSQTACNDGNDCTNDTCVIVGGGNYNPVCGAVNKANGTSCNRDGNACTLDSCQNGNCVAGPNKDCSGVNYDPQCQTPACNPANGNCFAQAINEGLHCNDGKDCTYAEVCNNGNCGAGAGNGLVRPAGTPCWDGEFCRPGTCNGSDKGCKNRVNLPGGAPCDPNNCTNAFCQGNGGPCVVQSCTGPSANCDQCGPNAPCSDTTSNPSFPCGCVSIPIYNPPN
jgi:hypothetical protein